MARKRLVPEATRLLAALAAVVAFLALSLAQVLPHGSQHGQPATLASHAEDVGGGSALGGGAHEARTHPGHAHGAHAEGSPSSDPGHHSQEGAAGTPCPLCTLVTALLPTGPLSLPVAADLAAALRWRPSGPPLPVLSVAEIAHQPRAPPRAP